MIAYIVKLLALSAVIALTIYERILFGEANAILVLMSPFLVFGIVLTLSDIKNELKLRTTYL